MPSKRKTPRTEKKPAQKPKSSAARKSSANKKAQASKSTPNKTVAAKKSAPRKKSGAPKQPVKNKKSTGSGGGFRRFIPLLIKVGAVLVILAAIGVIYLDAVITNHFEGKRWSIPAKVYARPLELYDGMPITEEQLAFELSQLNYRHVFDREPTSGSFTTQGSHYQLATRGFDFWEGAEAAKKVSFDIHRGRVQGLQSEQGSDGIVRMEPALIGGIYPAHNEDRVLVKLDQVPPLLVQALLAVEDRDFFEHFGISPKGIARALVANVTSGEVRQGGSTLTQQLVKNFYLTSERSLTRKATEAVMAVLLDFHYEKNDILEAYLNEVYLGQAGKRGIHGVGLASLYYFGQPLRELEAHQIALLVGIIKGPSWYDPRRNPERSVERRDQVLQLMLQQNVLDQRSYDVEVKKPLDVIRKPLYEDARYPAFLDLMKRQLRRDYKDEDLRSEGLRIFTTLDPWVQNSFENAALNQVKSLQKQYGKKLSGLEVAGVFTSSNTGEVAAIVGGHSLRYEGFNRALDAFRPIGSLAKPAVYLAALERGFTLASILKDEAVTHTLANGTTWTPENFEKESHGEVPMMVALANSYNQATVNLAMDVGIPAVVDAMTRLGVEKTLPAVPALSLGAVSLSPFEVAQMYQTIATEGFATPLRTIRSVLTADGQPLQRYELEVEQRFQAADIYALTYGMQETVRSGTAKTASLWLSPDLNLAGKTGTSDDQRDSWFAGFSGNYLGVVWMGIDDNKPTPLTGALGALPVWANTLSRQNLLPLQLAEPDNIEWVWVDPLKQARTKAHCENSLHLPIRKDSVPEKEISCGGGGRALNWFKGLFK
ncbi:penicillin-binding protein 1B [Ketobacter nezhaii]|uniref:penicillin-binding protein 1B n=1 Tax=Ketobacter sp. MCCC 1A13808 TaxID=2602738 RepID=UPI0018DC0946|nr:penicillin-binding protein 1B [Ketobacter sp. MCCC 1A13808]